MSLDRGGCGDGGDPGHRALGHFEHALGQLQRRAGLRHADVILVDDVTSRVRVTVRVRLLALESAGLLRYGGGRTAGIVANLDIGTGTDIFAVLNSCINLYFPVFEIWIQIQLSVLRFSISLLYDLSNTIGLYNL